MKKQKYYILNDGRYCYIIRRHGDMCMVRYTNGDVSLGDIHKDRLIPDRLWLVRRRSLSFECIK